MPAASAAEASGKKRKTPSKAAAPEPASDDDGAPGTSGGGGGVGSDVLSNVIYIGCVVLGGWVQGISVLLFECSGSAQT